MSETPEQKARKEIDADLTAAGWLVQDRDEIDLTAGRGVAVREFSMKAGFGVADYLLYLDRLAIGAVEAKAGGTLTGVEEQSAKYAAGLPDNLPAHKRPLPFLFESNGSVTYFTNGLDPRPRSREVFNFPRPDTLAELVTQPSQLRARLKELPPLDESKLWKAQAQAIRQACFWPASRQREKGINQRIRHFGRHERLEQKRQQHDQRNQHHIRHHQQGLELL